MRKTAAIITAMVLCLVIADFARAQTTEITYQGQLQNSSAPASGNFDFEFLLFDAANGGAQVGSTLTRNSVAVANGIFSVTLDFGSSFPGPTRFLEIHVKSSGGGAFTSLNPRQPITSSPYSIKSLAAETATSAVNATTAVTATNFSGALIGDVNGSQGSTIVARLQGRNVSNAAPLNDQVLKFNSATNQWGPGVDNAGSSVNAILNQTSAQAGANFNIGGNGTADIFNASTQFNIAGSRVFSIAGLNNLFVGPEAGTANTGGQNNSFFGRRAGTVNTGGTFNSFFGFESGFANTTGGDNAFFGTRAGSVNTTGNGNTFVGNNSGQSSTSGSENSFIGMRSGETNTTGSFNTAIGFDADFGSGNLIAATAIGAGAIANANHTVVLGTGQDAVQVPGSLAVTGAISGNLNAANITSGVVPIANGGTGSATKNFVDLTTSQLIGGDKTFSNTLSGNAVNSATNFRIGSLPVLSVNNFNNTFVGLHAGEANGSATSNAMFGSFAGESSTGSNNAFFGARAGATNTTGFRNAFFGSNAGAMTTSGNNNAFFGDNAGPSNTDGAFNTFLGRNAGFQNSSGSQNVFVGASTGASNASGANNTVVGTFADVSASNLSFATALGAGAVANASNTVVLGRAADSVVIPGSALDVGGAVTATRVGIPDQFLQVNGGSSSSIRLTAQSAAGAEKPLLIRNLSAEAAPGVNNNIQFQLGPTASPSTKMTIDAAGSVGIGTISPAQPLDVTGNIRIGTGTTGCVQDRDGTVIAGTCSSDIRFKKNVVPIVSVLSAVTKLQPVTFDWRVDEFKEKHFGSRRSFGLIAQNVANALPELVSIDDAGYLAVNYSKLPLLAIQAIKEQQAQIESQQKLIEEQRAENAALKARILAIEKALVRKR